MSWSNIVSKNIPLNVSKELEEELAPIRMRHAEMENQVYQARMFELLGDFWYFLVEGSSDDRNMAVNLRQSLKNQNQFKSFLMSIYGDKWFYKCEYGKYDCCFAHNRRCDEYQREYVSYCEEQDLMKRWEDEFKQEQEAKEQEAEEMLIKYQTGEISYRDYRLWEKEKEMDELDADEAYHKSCLY